MIHLECVQQQQREFRCVSLGQGAQHGTNPFRRPARPFGCRQRGGERRPNPAGCHPASARVFDVRFLYRAYRCVSRTESDFRSFRRVRPPVPCRSRKHEIPYGVLYELYRGEEEGCDQLVRPLSQDVRQAPATRGHGRGASARTPAALTAPSKEGSEAETRAREQR